MNPETFKLLTSFIVKSRRLLGGVDSDKLLHDRDYARQLFRRVDEEGEEDLVLLSLQLREGLGLLDGGPPEKEKTQDKPQPAAGKYVHGLRG